MISKVAPSAGNRTSRRRSRRDVCRNVSGGGEFKFPERGPAGSEGDGEDKERKPISIHDNARADALFHLQLYAFDKTKELPITSCHYSHLPSDRSRASAPPFFLLHQNILRL